MVRGAQAAESPDRLAAMNTFITRYWRPVFYFLRARGYPLHKAEDLTQEFFARFFERDWIRPADASRGRFRSFLLTLVVRFLSDQGPKRAPRQAVFDGQQVAISTLVSDRERSFDPSDNATPEQVFMKQWAKSVITTARRLLEAWCQDQDRPEWFEVFAATYLAGSADEQPTQQELADRLNLSRDQVRYGLKEASRKFAELLRAEVADQVTSADEIDAEIGELERLVAQS